MPISFLSRFFITLCCALSFGLHAMALDLQSARQAGILKELPTGYVAVQKSSKEAEELAKQINDARQKAYEQISKENGQPVEVVGQIAAKNIAEKLNHP